jgi:hypothetical protein
MYSSSLTIYFVMRLKDVFPRIAVAFNARVVQRPEAQLTHRGVRVMIPTRHARSTPTPNKERREEL